MSLGTPLAAYIRVPLSWHQSTTYAFFPDETHTMIRREYTHPTQEHSKRHFCGFCGTSLSYWSEDPHSEAEYINLTLGSLLRADLTDLEEMGLMPDRSTTPEEEEGEGEGEDKNMEELEDEQGAPRAMAPDPSVVLRQSLGVPWFDTMVKGMKLGKMRRSQGTQQSRDGKVHIEWEIVEYSNNDNSNDEHDNEDVEMATTTSTLSKRKRVDQGDAADA